MALASNKPAYFSRSILARLGWAGWFDAVEGPDTVGEVKPAAPMLHACLARMETERCRTRYVGDMPLDAETGRRAGIEVVLVRGGSAPDDALSSLGAPVLDHVGALPEYLRALGWPRVPA
jgi:phosphoglycolate phosphatase